jgi:ABC-type dipeptide/oligopeptide/nickel transport system permease component
MTHIIPEFLSGKKDSVPQNTTWEGYQTLLFNGYNKKKQVTMPPFVQFVIRRFLIIPISLVIVTMVLYAGVMLTPPEARAQLYFPPNMRVMSEERLKQFTEILIKRHHLRDPYLVQYGYWVQSLLTGNWGYSPTMKMEVLPALISRTPATLELTFYSLLIFIPLGLVSGVIAGWKPYGWRDNLFRIMSFIGLAIPPFILALLFLSFFYANLEWFAPERISYVYGYEITKESYNALTGFITLDALLNGRLDILADGLRHLAMPVITLCLYNWAVLGRVTRTTMMELRNKEYIISARARGLSEQRVMWKHGFRSVLAPSLTTIGLSSASILMGAFIVEIIYSFHGISEVLTTSMKSVPDAAASLGFAVYSVIMVLTLMFCVDILQALLDPRIREEVLKS